MIMAAVPAVAEAIAHADLKANIEVMSGFTGVSIRDVAIPDLSDDDIEAVRRLIAEYCVAVFPGQFLAPQDHVAFLARLGRITVTPGVDMRTEFENVHMVANRGDADNPVSGGFHTDTSFVAKPPSFTSLSAVEMPDHGGDTIFCNQYVAYNTLSDVMKHFLEGMRFKHVVSGTDHPEAVPDPVWQPAVRTNPVTGRKALYVTYKERCVEAEGMTDAEGRNLIDFLYSHSLQNHAMYRHRWSVGDFVIWDNRCSLHAAVYDHGDQPRKLHRVMCEGEVPFE
jgi:taurine dioxygenase